MYLCLLPIISLICYQSYVIKKTGSKIISADKLHYISDFLTHIIVIISLYLSNTTWYVDAIAGIGIAMYILRASYILFKDSIKNLSDEELNPTERSKINTIVQNFNTQGLYQLKTRSAANKIFIQFHLKLDGVLSLQQTNKIVLDIIKELKIEYPKSEIIIQQNPISVECDES